MTRIGIYVALPEELRACRLDPADGKCLTGYKVGMTEKTWPDTNPRDKVEVCHFKTLVPINEKAKEFYRKKSKEIEDEMERKLRLTVLL